MIWSLIKVVLFVAAIAGLTFGAGLLMDTGGAIRIAAAASTRSVPTTSVYCFPGSTLARCCHPDSASFLLRVNRYSRRGLAGLVLRASCPAQAVTHTR